METYPIQYASHRVSQCLLMTLGVVVDNHSDGTMDIIKTIVFVKPVQMTTTRAMFSGDIMVPAWRPGPWAVKKAFQSLLDKVLGYHVTWSTVTPKPVIQRSKSNANTWDATDDEIDQGRKYIIDHCPVDEAESDLTTWIWKKIKPDSGSPIAGWPEMKARKIAANIKKASQGVAVHRFFPLVFFDMKFIWSTVLIPMMIPFRIDLLLAIL